MLILNSSILFPFPEESFYYLFCNSILHIWRLLPYLPLFFPTLVFPNRPCIFRSLSCLFFSFNLLQLIQCFFWRVLPKAGLAAPQSLARAESYSVFEFMAKWKLTKSSRNVRGDDFLWSHASSNSIRITVLPSACCQQSFSNTAHN